MLDKSSTGVRLLGWWLSLTICFLTTDFHFGILTSLNGSSIYMMFTANVTFFLRIPQRVVELKEQVIYHVFYVLNATLTVNFWVTKKALNKSQTTWQLQVTSWRPSLAPAWRKISWQKHCMVLSCSHGNAVGHTGRSPAPHNFPTNWCCQPSLVGDVDGKYQMRDIKNVQVRAGRGVKLSAANMY